VLTALFTVRCCAQLNQGEPPEQLVWCGVDSVLMSWGRLVVMAGPQADVVRYPTQLAWLRCFRFFLEFVSLTLARTYVFDDPVVLVPEVDGVRIISNTVCEFLHRVPGAPAHPPRVMRSGCLCHIAFAACH
jgi:hypothetical protein